MSSFMPALPLDNLWAKLWETPPREGKERGQEGGARGGEGEGEEEGPVILRFFRFLHLLYRLQLAYSGDLGP